MSKFSKFIRLRSKPIIFCQSYTTSLIICAILSILSLYAYNRFGIMVSSCVGAIYILYAISHEPKDTLLFVVFGLSNTHILGIFNISASVCICAISSMMSIFNKKAINSKLLLLVFLYLSYTPQLYFRFNDYQSAFIMPIKLMMIILYLQFYSTDIETYKVLNLQMPRLLEFGAFGVIINTITSLALVGYSGRARVINNDSNILAVQSVFWISILFALYLRSAKISALKFYFYLFILTVITFLCGSRNGIIILIICFALNVIFNLKKFGKLLLLIVGMLGTVSVFFASTYGRYFLNTMLSRTRVMEANGDISNGRFDIWQRYVQALDNTRFGWLLGFGNYTNVGLEEMGHSCFIEDISGYGIIGLILIWSILIVIHKSVIIHKTQILKKTVYYFVPYIIVLTGNITLRGLTSNVVNIVMIYVSTLLVTSNNISLDENNRYAK